MLLSPKVLTNYKRPDDSKAFFFSNDYLVKLWQRRPLIILGCGLTPERVRSAERLHSASKESQTNDREGRRSAKGHRAAAGMPSEPNQDPIKSNVYHAACASVGGDEGPLTQSIHLIKKLFLISKDLLLFFLLLFLKIVIIFIWSEA